MPNLVGIGLSQVPTNSMLGGLAYQDPEHASIKNLDLKNLSQINSEIADTAVDVFVYDTRKDSDGGAWRKRTQNTSWYNETLRTATRGTRKEFPAVAVIVAEYEKLTIYDGDDPDLPMWMIFNYGTNNGSLSGMAMLYSNGKAVFALNGIISSVGSGGWHDGLTEINLLADFSRFRNNSNVTDWSGGIGTRNTSGGYGGFYNTSSMYIVNASVNDVAMTVLPNAQIDAATGLPIPTIAVATAAGVSVIKDNGTVVDITSGTTPYTDNVHFYGNNRISFGADSGTSDKWIQFYDIPNSDATFAHSDANYNWYTNWKGGTSSVWATPTMDQWGNNINDSVISKYDRISFGSNSGLGLQGTLESYEPRMISHVTTEYQTGYMVGRISQVKGAFLSDTDTTNISGTELITNGTFDSNVNNWGATFATVSHQTDRMRVTNTGTNGWAKQSFSVTSGVKYVATVNLTSLGTASNLILRIGTDGNPDLGTAEATVTTSNNGVYSLTFTASSDTLYFIVRVNGVSGTYLEVDNISVRIAELDRSVNNNGLAVYGTITKSAVATGAELVSYSGFSATNNLVQPYNSGLNFGTGDFCFVAWIKKATLSTNHYVLDRNDGSTENDRLSFMINSSGQLYIYSGPSNATARSDSNVFVGSSAWRMVMVKRDSGVIIFGLDGKEYTSTTTVGNWSTTNLTGSGNENLFIGQYGGSGTPGNVAYNADYGIGEIANVRLSASAPSPEQFKKMYEDEKHLYQENAKCTLHGSSDAVTALAYDDTTNLLHVGTSAGRSEFQGLCRINNTTDAVTTAISASNGLVAEQ